MKKKFNYDTLNNDAKEIINSKQLDVIQLNKIGHYIVYADANRINLTNLTYYQILQKAERYFEESYETEKKNVDINNLLEEKTNVLKLTKSSDGKCWKINLIFFNHTNKIITSQKGNIEIPHFFPYRINGLIAKFENGINPGELKKASVLILCNPFSSSQGHYQNKEIVKFAWLPKKNFYATD